MIALQKLAPHSTRCVFIDYSLDHKGYHCLDISTNRGVITRHVIFYEACFPFVASPHPTNDYEFLSEMDPVLSPIRTRLSAGTLTTMADNLTAPVVEAGDPTHRVVEADGLTVTSGSSTACLTALTTSPMPRAATMTPVLTSEPHATPMTPLVASSVAPISPPTTQPVPRVRSTGAVPVSPMVHPHPM
jgi:hypothetical protein